MGRLLDDAGRLAGKSVRLGSGVTGAESLPLLIAAGAMLV